MLISEEESLKNEAANFKNEKKKVGKKGFLIWKDIFSSSFATIGRIVHIVLNTQSTTICLLLKYKQTILINKILTLK